MRQWLKWGAGLLLVTGAALGCGQELVVPTRAQSAGSTADIGPREGITGVGGAASDGPSQRLPVLDDPGFPFGGSDDADDAGEGQSCASCGGASTNKDAKNPIISTPASAGDSARGGAGGAADEATPPAVLLFSEYVEGSANLKALELYALEGGSLEACELLTFYNGKSEPSRQALHGSLARGELRVLCSKDLTTQLPSVCTQANLAFNGDDALALSCAGSLLDVIGEIGVDPGESWGGGATQDHTLQRRCTVTSGRTTTQPFEIDPEWITFGRDTFSGLGQRGCDEVEVTNPPE